MDLWRASEGKLLLEGHNGGRPPIGGQFGDYATGQNLNLVSEFFVHQGPVKKGSNK